jgi:hypothetical protein
VTGGGVAIDEIAVDIERLAADIAEYFARHPHAADTHEGIQRWWLSGSSALVSSRDVERAVRVLERRGALETRTLPDGVQIFTSARRTHAP